MDMTVLMMTLLFALSNFIGTAVYCCMHEKGGEK